MVRIPGSHPGGPGSIPGIGNHFVVLFSQYQISNDTQKYNLIERELIETDKIFSLKVTIKCHIHFTCVQLVDHVHIVRHFVTSLRGHSKNT